MHTLELGSCDLELSEVWGRTGFDQVNALEAACRGRSVGLVKNRVKKITANDELALAA